MFRWNTLMLVMMYLSSTVTPVFAEVYKWTDKYGNVHYGDHPPVAEKVEQVHIEKENRDIQTGAIPALEVKPLSGGNASTSQQHTISEEVFHTEYKFPDYQCFDAYPGELSSIDVRPGYASHTLSDGDIDSLTRLFKALDRNWRGGVVTIDCRGTTSEPREKKEFFTARISGRWSMSGQLELDIDYYNKEKSTRRQYYWWLIENSKLYFGDRRDIRAALEWVINLESVTPEKLAFSKIIYRPNVKQIQVKEIAVISRSLYLTELLYTNGLLTSIYNWRLS